MELIQTLFLGIVEGVTEILPVSAKGHLLLCAKVMKIDLDSSFWRMLAIFIQLGAVMAVVVYFRHRLVKLLSGSAVRARGAGGMTPLEIAMAQRAPIEGAAAQVATAGPGGAPAYGERAAKYLISPLLLVIVGTVPVLIVGYLTHKWVEEHLANSPKAILAALGIGGILIVLIEMFRPAVTTHKLEQMTLSQAFGIGCAQILAAIFPGTSRSAATIMPGMMMGLSRESAAEFSFFLAIPALFAACGYSLLKELRHHGLSGQEWVLLSIGAVVAFLVAWVVIAAFMNFIRNHSFVSFGLYRIVLVLAAIGCLALKHGRI